MNNDHLNVAGKSAGEISRDIEDFLALSCPVRARKEMDLADLLPGLNMKEQFSFALLMEARHQGWDPSAAEQFYRRFCAPYVGSEIAEPMLAAFRDTNGEAFQGYLARYGSDFEIDSRAYWNSCLAVAIDAQAVPTLMEYFRTFLFTVMEFAYMDDRNPADTYVWSYYGSFRRILDELSEPQVAILHPEVCKLGGSTGARDADGYTLSLGVDVRNPNEKHAVLNARIDVTLKDKENRVITVIADQILRIDPDSVFHYGISRRIRGNAVAHISASVKAERFEKSPETLAKNVKLTKISINRAASPERLTGTLKNSCGTELKSFALHYQYLSAENKILGGGCEWFFDALADGEERTFTVKSPVSLKKATKVVYSADFRMED